MPVTQTAERCTAYCFVAIYQLTLNFRQIAVFTSRVGMLWKFGAGTWKLQVITWCCVQLFEWNLEFANASKACMYGEELEADEQPNIQKELNASISMISVQQLVQAQRGSVPSFPTYQFCTRSN